MTNLENLPFRSFVSARERSALKEIIKIEFSIVLIETE